MSLSPYIRLQGLTRHSDLIKRAEEIYQSVPERFFLPTDDDTIMATEPESLCTQLMYRLEYLFNLFLILRLPGKEKSGDSSSELIATAIQILECMAFVQQYHDKLVDFSFGQGWWLVFYSL